MIDVSEFRDTRDEIVRMLDGDSPHTPEDVYDGRSSEADLYTHPGFAEYSGFLEKTFGLGRDKYQDYLDSVSSSLEDSVESGRPVGVLYPEEFQEETEGFVSRFVDPEEVTMIPTYSDTSGTGISASSRPVSGTEETGFFSGAARYAGFIDSVEDGGTLNLYGELGYQCPENASWLAEEVTEELGRDVEVVEQRSFPENSFLPLPYRNVKLPEPIGEKFGDLMSSLHTPPQEK